MSLPRAERIRQASVGPLRLQASIARQRRRLILRMLLTCAWLPEAARYLLVGCGPPYVRSLRPFMKHSTTDQDERPRVAVRDASSSVADREGEGTRGSMLAMGVPVALVLTSLVWYLIGLSNTVCRVESMRMGADRSAYEAAVWHARGMNVIASLNLLAASLSSVSIAWGLTGSSLSAVMLITSAHPEAGPIGAQVGAGAAAVTKWIDDQGKAIDDLQKITSGVTPLVAEDLAGVRSGTRFCLPLSSTLVSDANLPTLVGSSSVSKFPRKTISVDSPALPVSNAGAYEFCSIAADSVVDMTTTLLTRVGAPWTIDVFVADGYDYATNWKTAATAVGCTGGFKAASVWAMARPGYGNPNPEAVFQVQSLCFEPNTALQDDAENMRRLSGDSGTGATLPARMWTASQAQFYFNDGSGKPWKDTAAIAMVTPAWAADLARVHVPSTATPPSNVFGLLSLGTGPGSAVPSDIVTLLNDPATWTRMADFIH